MSHYLIVVRSNRFWLVGPFDSQKAAADWGAGGDYDGPRNTTNNPSDDPRWQTIELAEVPAGVRVAAPADGPMEPD